VVSTSVLKVDLVLDFFPSFSWYFWGVRSNRGCSNFKVHFSINLTLYHHCWVIELSKYPRKVGYSTENYIFPSTKKKLNYPPQNMRNTWCSLPLRVYKLYIRVSFSDTFLRWLPPCFFIKQVILHLKCSVSSTVTKYLNITSDTAQYSKVSLSATSASDE
jgi:hypothetical protein